jgi:hypothetical protein
MTFVPPLRRLAPGLVGLVLAVLLLWRSGAALEREAERREAFSLRVAEPAAVLELGDSSIAWRGWVTPVAERERVELRIDGVPAAFHGDAEAGELRLPLTGLGDQPGWHFVELELARRGGRGERVVDPVLIGRFAPAEDHRRAAKPCATVLSASPALIQALAVALLERELLPVLQANEHMGPDTALSEATLELRDDGVVFELELRGVNTLAVAGAISLAVVDDRRIHAKLLLLTKVDFRGRLRNSARGLGAGGGALIGALISGPLAPVGAAAGWVLADEFVTDKARKLVREQIEAGLEELAKLDLLPTHAELAPGKPASRVRLGFCEQTRVRETGLSAGLWLDPDPLDVTARFDLGVPGPLVTAAAPTSEPLVLGEDVRVELSIDAVNALLSAWTQTGLLLELIGEQQAFERANAELAAWTPLRLAALVPTRPPVLSPAGGPSDGWRYGIGGLALDLIGVDEQPWGVVYVAAAGELRPVWEPDAGRLSLAGSLDRLAVTCARPSPEGEPTALHGCFSEVLEAVDLRARIDEHLRPGASRLPSLAIGELLAKQVGVQIGGLELTRPRPGVLRLSARLVAGE